MQRENEIKKYNGFIYKLYCKDSSITDVYVGSTENTFTRYNNHKVCCNSPNCEDYNLYVHQFVRANGGFDNWKMVVVENVSFNDKDELLQREGYWTKKLNATLNKVIAGTHIKYEVNKRRYDILASEEVQCPYCSKVTSLWNVNRHMKSKICQKFKQKYLDVHKDKNENEIDLYLNKLKQNALNKLSDEED